MTTDLEGGSHGPLRGMNPDFPSKPRTFRLLGATVGMQYQLPLKLKCTLDGRCSSCLQCRAKHLQKHAIQGRS